ncbi:MULTISPECIES: HinT-interacting membrane complex protein P80 [unclassified Mycoplasma]|uniref:HinT-interacting membrane complex protein P80 n=1 Tax=unclassified Mycoplasma TaxID=2683645 RepID=UPI00211D0246|nr:MULTISPECIES: hypothetical protein [unclassified Mycoplasma]UUM19834.1 hypothetical protein NPA11_00105 [Mycoplasma sp. 1578d]UUM24818.1 hypothetical protein NPA12_00105 [Mycoplasma sp. 3686d]
MAKRQKSFFEKLSEINAKHEEKKASTKSQKRKKWMFITLGLLGAAVITSISVPLGISVNKVNYVEPLSDDTVLFKYDNSGKKQDLTVGQTLELIKGTDDKTTQKIDQLYKEAVLFWYNKEVEASKEYQRIWNLSLYNGEAQRNDIALKSFSDINKDNENKLKDLKNQIIAVYGFKNWQKQFSEELSKKEEYGKSATEEEALEFLNFKVIESEALRHYKIKLDKNVALREIERVASIDIPKVDQNGQVVAQNGSQVVLIKKGEKIFNYFIAQDANNVKEANYAVSKTDNTRIATITTESYINQFKSIKPLIEKYFSLNKLILPTIYKLPGKINANLSLEWQFDKKDKEALINLAKYTIFSKDNSFEIKSNIDVLKSFKEAKNYFIPTSGESVQDLNKSRSETQSLLDVLTVDTTNLGSAGVTTFASELSKNIPLVVSLKTDNLPSISLSDLFTPAFSSDIKNNIQTQLDEIKKITNKNQAIAKLDSLNRYIDSLFNNLSDAEFANIIKEQFNKHINLQVNNENLYSFAYNLSDLPGAKLIVDPKGTYLVRNEVIDKLDLLFTYLQNDLSSIANGNSSFFKIEDALNKVWTKNVVLADTLNNKEFQDYLLTKTNKFSDNKQKYTQDDINTLKAENNSILEGIHDQNKTDLISTLSKWLDEKLSGNSYNYVVDQGSIKRVINHNPFETANKNALDELTSFVEEITKGAQ